MSTGKVRSGSVKPCKEDCIDYHVGLTIDAMPWSSAKMRGSFQQTCSGRRSCHGLQWRPSKRRISAEPWYKKDAYTQWPE